MDKCRDCLFFDSPNNSKGQCIINKKHIPHFAWVNACSKFYKGKYNGEDPAELKMRIIKENITKNYKGGRFG